MYYNADDTLGRSDQELFDEQFANHFVTEDKYILCGETLLLSDHTVPLPCIHNCGNCQVTASKIMFRLHGQAYIFACATAMQCSTSN
jgi:hypothetical protein